MLIQVDILFNEFMIHCLEKNPFVCLKWISMMELYNYLVGMMIAYLIKLEQCFGKFYRLGLIKLYIYKLHYYNYLNLPMQF